MPYDILSDDITDNSGNGPQRRGPNNGNNVVTISPFLVHLILILFLVAILGLVYLFFFAGGDKVVDNKDTITFVGTLEEFNQSYNGDLIFSSSSFELQTPRASFSEGSKRVALENFVGSIYHVNRSLAFEGTADKITFNKNIINLNGDNFVIYSNRGTDIQLFYDFVNLNFKKGRIKVNNELNYEFENGVINATNYNLSLNFDGVFSLSGKTDSFTLTTEEDKIAIYYDNS